MSSFLLSKDLLQYLLYFLTQNTLLTVYLCHKRIHKLAKYVNNCKTQNLIECYTFYIILSIFNYLSIQCIYKEALKLNMVMKIYPL